jgi:soluble lytic murein transglycosylase
LLLALVLLAACSLTPTPEAVAPGGTPAPASAPSAASPSDLLSRGLQLRQQGDYDGAGAVFADLLQQHPQASEAPSAHYYLAEAYLLRGRYPSAAHTLERALPMLDDATLQARGLLLLARAYAGASDAVRAAEAYQRYAAQQTVLAPYALRGLADQQAALGQLDAAALAYEQAAASDVATSWRVAAYEKAIAARSGLGQPQAALELYRGLFALDLDAGERARLLLAASDAASAANDTNTAHAWLHELITQQPAADVAPAALARLQAAGAAPDPALAVSVLVAHERWVEALPLIDAALTQPQADDARAELQRLRALAQRDASDLPGALAAFDALIDGSSISTATLQARLDRAQTQGWTGDVAGATLAYRSFADAYGEQNAELAAEALARAAELLRRQGDAATALEVELQLGAQFPQTAQGPRALETAAHALEAQGDNAGALRAWQALGAATEGSAQARALYWAARAAQRSDQQTTAQTLFEQAATVEHAYYGVRAAETLGNSFAGATNPATPLADDDWRVVEDWLAGWATLPLSDTTGRDAAAVARARELGAVGLHSEAANEWTHARVQAIGHPAALYWLAREAQAAGATFPALRSAELLAAQAAQASAPPPPAPLLRLIYPTPYAELALPVAREFGLDPRLLYAMIRQESLFNPNATSWVGARGLTQVMPETGQGIAANLNVAPFHPDDLYQPALSLRFGAFYLAQQIRAMEGSAQGGLAAYNGGPGNAQRWAGGSNISDPDAFAETIDYPETQHYVQAVYGYYGMYRRLYDIE